MKNAERGDFDGDISFVDELFRFHSKFVNRLRLLLESQVNLKFPLDDSYFINLHHAVVLKTLFELSLNDTSIKSCLINYLDKSISSIGKAEFSKFEQAIDDILIMPTFEWAQSPTGYLSSNIESMQNLWMIHASVSDHSDEIKFLIVKKMGVDITVTFENFDEHAYRESNPDVDACVTSGQFSSGLQHFREWGAKEGRKMKIVRQTNANKI